ncbi:MAG: glycosyltransferase, partial [Oligoflexia bacterium]|nr:glycosyltransferase [Oligoflexia bacterium]
MADARTGTDNPVEAVHTRLSGWRRALPGFVARQQKTLAQASYGWQHPRHHSFVFGCQRSGTKMVLRVLENSPETRIYHENHAVAFRDFQLRGDTTIRALVHLNPAPVQVFKPICDSYRADLLLARFPKARALWIYRHYDDVANSATQKWGEHQRKVVSAVAAGDLDRFGWRTARLPPQVAKEIARAWRPDLSPAEGALLFWYMRNAFFFELGLHRDPRVLLARYETLVHQPVPAFQAVFAHLGATFDPAYVKGVRTSSVGRCAPPQASPEIRDLCADLASRLDQWTPPPARPVSPVLIMTNTLSIGGAEHYAVGVANWFARQGAKVSLAATGGELVEALASDVAFVPTDLRRVRSDLPRAVREVRAILHQQSPAVVIANSLVVTWIARLAQPRHHARVVTVAHGWPNHRYRLVGPLMRVSDAVIAVSPDVRDRLVAGGLPDSLCTVIFNGVDCSRLGQRTGPGRVAARAAMGAGPDDLLVISVGRLAAQKAHQHIIAIAQHLRDIHPRLRFAIVGPGERLDELTQAIQAAGVADRVHLTGLRTDVPDLLGAADIYVNCSDWEGMPLSTIEAMASSLPIIATH